MENPYQAPASAGEVPGLPPDGPESIRRAHLNHEASVRSIGTLCYLGAILWSLGAVAALPGLFRVSQLHQYGGWVSGMVQFLVGLILPGALAILLFFGGRGLRKLTPWGRVIGIVIGVIGLAAIPVGTVLGIYILFLLLSKKGRLVFSPGYKEVITATPQVKYKTSPVVWVVLGLFILLLLLAWFMPAM
ncbi:MAG: hypothetical protein EOP87_10375 [Verrucomicrobiaceae bacterium]|nr:MAG: hypothetical protein EOP87_10375 [Verrucomicrobiaceae bacterium]